MRGQFFKPIPSIHSTPVGREISDADLLKSWGGVSPEEIRALPDDPRPANCRYGKPASAKANARTRAIRERVIALKEAGRG